MILVRFLANYKSRQIPFSDGKQAHFSCLQSVLSTCIIQSGMFVMNLFLIKVLGTNFRLDEYVLNKFKINLALIIK